jgi:hypothetical protein
MVEEEKEFDPIDRPRGILNKKDRRWIVGDLTYDDKNSEYQRRRRIRERVNNAVLDFLLITDGLDDADIGHLFEESHQWASGVEAATRKELGLGGGEERTNEGSLDTAPPFLQAWGAAFRFFYLAFGASHPEIAAALVEKQFHEALIEFAAWAEEVYLPNATIELRVNHDLEDKISVDDLSDSLPEALPDDPHYALSAAQALWKAEVISYEESWALLEEKFQP